ncbi:hypothetical protein ASPVEDRAFT_86275 [Aspergillus versicolor CBS 583.65]|uniref:Rhodopsin domain-containing protein n=1 Tax=Aspergillus versicolor CBS 583.65 TaxID=1036611 RepID=A0A1L9PTP1_ASPVE|nr:uncharacterized protein ASPVEDRAFT_86275 [Aspergillus versicolor CBS 583.65]OJJ04897.1 hypothetical protein ASPVEDRAFT_86275 [Aspergillus versicolor CBS 583.65]
MANPTPNGPFQVLTGSNRGPLITLVSITFLIAAIIFVLAKIGSAIYFKQRRTALNTPVWIALIIAIIQVVVLQKAVDNGLGRHQVRLNGDALETASKFAFAAQILLILVLSLSKLSTILLVWKLTPNNSLRRTCTITAGVILVWTVFSIFAIAFQCQMPKSWLYTPGRCAGEGALFYPIGVLNILTELILVGLPFAMMRSVQMALNKRVKILGSFSTRLCVVGLAVAHVALLPSFTHSTDVSWDSVNWQITGQAMMLTSIIIACVPTLYHIFAGLHSGLTTTQIPDGVELRRTKTSTYINQTSSSGGSKSRGRSRDRRRESPFNPEDGAVVTEISSLPNRNHNRSRNGDYGRRSSSSDGNESTRHLTMEGKQGGVMRTVDITVEVEDHRGSL